MEFLDGKYAKKVVGRRSVSYSRFHLRGVKDALGLEGVVLGCI